MQGSKDGHKMNDSLKTLKKKHKELSKKIEIMEEKPLQNGKSLIGHLRSAVYSPNFKKVVGIAMIKKEFWDKKTTFELELNGKKSKGSVCDLPLV